MLRALTEELRDILEDKAGLKSRLDKMVDKDREEIAKIEPDRSFPYKDRVRDMNIKRKYVFPSGARRRPLKQYGGDKAKIDDIRKKMKEPSFGDRISSNPTWKGPKRKPRDVRTMTTRR